MPSPPDLKNVQGDILYVHVVVSSFFADSFFTGKVSPRRPRPFISSGLTIIVSTSFVNSSPNWYP
ncbi:hypothetical protein GJ744_000958 [Endocarpon pusillum]|uniref:Uncharacterized protein n=1 Tax=Endocarpon pusillum TaxID=364733 RepID=A0A8H7ACW5_9EURO|nr:hypothetical protein GJ744_000958 [Endocarpon pusillum]